MTKERGYLSVIFFQSTIKTLMHGHDIHVIYNVCMLYCTDIECTEE